MKRTISNLEDVLGLNKWKSAAGAFLFVFFLQGQQIGFTGDETGSIYRDQFNGGIILHTNGWGASVRWGKWTSYRSSYDAELSFTTLKHTKEIKRKNVYQIESAPSFVYGKLYYVGIWSVGMARTSILNEKPYWGGIDVRWTYGIGADLFWLLPTYLQIIHTNAQTAFYYTTVERYDPAQHKLEDIYGRASYFEGISHSLFVPGGYVKSAFAFDFAAKRSQNRFVEAGVLLHLAAIPIRIMAFQPSQQVFIKAYVSLYVGRKFLYQRYVMENS